MGNSLIPHNQLIHPTIRNKYAYIQKKKENNQWLDQEPSQLESKWKNVTHQNIYYRPEYGKFQIFKNNFTLQEVQMYKIVLKNQTQYQKFIDLIKWRNNCQYLPKIQHFIVQNATEICTSRYEIKVFVERISLRLSDLTDIPFPENLYFMSAALKGFKYLLSSGLDLKRLRINENLIGVNREGEVKVWMNANLCEFEGEGSEQDFVNEEQILNKVVDLVQENTDDRDYGYAFIRYLSDRKIMMNGDFNNIISQVYNYGKQMKVVIPKFAFSVRDILTRDLFQNTKLSSEDSFLNNGLALQNNQIEANKQNNNLNLERLPIKNKPIQNLNTLQYHNQKPNNNTIHNNNTFNHQEINNIFDTQIIYKQKPNSIQTQINPTFTQINPTFTNNPNHLTQQFQYQNRYPNYTYPHPNNLFNKDYYPNSHIHHSSSHNNNLYQTNSSQLKPQPIHKINNHPITHYQNSNNVPLKSQYIPNNISFSPNTNHYITNTLQLSYPQPNNLPNTQMKNKPHTHSNNIPNSQSNNINTLKSNSAQSSNQLQPYFNQFGKSNLIKQNLNHQISHPIIRVNSTNIPSLKQQTIHSIIQPPNHNKSLPQLTQIRHQTPSSQPQYLSNKIQHSNQNFSFVSPQIISNQPFSSIPQKKQLLSLSQNQEPYAVSLNSINVIPSQKIQTSHRFKTAKSFKNNIVENKEQTQSNLTHTQELKYFNKKDSQQILDPQIAIDLAFYLNSTYT